MKLALYINTLGCGGAERVMSVLANGLFARGHSVTMITDYSRDNEYLLFPGIERIVLDGPLGEISKAGRTARTVSRIRKLRRLCIEHNINVMLSFLPANNFRAIMAMLFLSTKNVISVRVDPKKEYKSKKYRFFAKTLYRLTSGCVFQTTEAQSWFPKAIQKKSHIIYNPVSDVFFQTERTCGEHSNIVTAGRLTKQKNFALLIRAFAAITHEYPDETLTIYGEGQLRYELEELVVGLNLNGRVSLPGNVTNIVEKEKDAQLFVLSSDYEGMPNALMEAMALGLPVIATDCDGGGARALIVDGENGFLIPKNNEAAMVKALRRVLSDADFAQCLGEKARESSRAYAAENITAQWEDYLYEIEGKPCSLIM